MSEIGKKSVGTLIDELFTTCHKCWEAQDKLHAAASGNETAIGFEAAMSAQKLNKRRNQLIRAIDERLGDEDVTQTEKSY